jgi:hypothetical protein
MADGLRARVQPTTAMPSIPTVAGVSAGRRGRATPPPSAAAATAMRLKGSRTAPSKLAGSQSTALMTTVPSRTVMALPAQAAALGVVAATASIEAPVTWTAVLTLYSRAVELEPQNAAHWARRGDAYADSGSLELALADYEQSAICEVRTLPTAPLSGTKTTRHLDFRLTSYMSMYMFMYSVRRVLRPRWSGHGIMPAALVPRQTALGRRPLASALDWRAYGERLRALSSTLAGFRKPRQSLPVRWLSRRALQRCICSGPQFANASRC